MKIDKITREDLRAIRLGQARTYELPNYSAILSAKASAYSLGRVDGCRFSCSVESERNAITIIKLPR